MRESLLLSIVAAALVVIAPLSAAGQSLPRASDGKPDLSGIWQAVNSAAWNILPHGAEAGVPGGLGVVEGKADLAGQVGEYPVVVS